MRNNEEEEKENGEIFRKIIFNWFPTETYIYIYNRRENSEN